MPAYHLFNVVSPLAPLISYLTIAKVHAGCGVFYMVVPSLLLYVSRGSSVVLLV